MKRSSLVLAFVLLSPASRAWADLYTFDRITSNSGVDVAAQLFVNVTNPGGGQVDFKFTNAVGLAASITQIYFDDDAGVLGSIDSLSETLGVSFSINGAPSDLPSGDTISFAATHWATADAPVSHNGIDSSIESLVIRFDLVALKSFTDVIAALDNGTLRIGLHVQALPDDESDSFVNNGRIVPSPSAAILGLLGLVSLTLRRAPAKTGA
jgi:hypothetical protein